MTLHPLQNLFATTFQESLSRKASTQCSRWAMKYRIMGTPYPGPWGFDHHPWLRQMHDDPEDVIVGKKAAQMGYTECALNRVFHAIDIHGSSVMYILPSESDAGDFSSGRFDPALELSEHLSRLFSSVKNTGHKRAGSASLYVRGSRSKSKLKSVPAGILIFDEVDEMVLANLALAEERASGQLNKLKFYISTPTIPNIGIDALFNDSDQKYYFFTCPSCGKITELTFPECLVVTADDFTSKKIRDSHLICKECKNILPHAAKKHFLKNGIWVPKKPDKAASGYSINQMYSTTVKPFEIAVSYLKALKNPYDEQEFHNSKMGETHIVDGAKINDEMIQDCTRDFRMQESYTSPTRLVTLGVDVGKYFHCVFVEWIFQPGAFECFSSDLCNFTRGRLILATKVQEFTRLHKLLDKIGTHFAVMDANPERRIALEFARHYQGRAKVCFYGRSETAREIVVNEDASEPTVTVNRTSWLDASLGRFKNQSIQLPIDTPKEFKDHVKALVRIYEKDKWGNPVGRYTKAESDDDHYAHAFNYAEIALPMANLAQNNFDVTGVI